MYRYIAMKLSTREELAWTLCVICLLPWLFCNALFVSFYCIKRNTDCCYSHCHDIKIVRQCVIRLVLLNEAQYWWLFIFIRLKINHESHEFILESSTIANKYNLTCRVHRAIHNLLNYMFLWVLVYYCLWSGRLSLSVVYGATHRHTVYCSQTNIDALFVIHKLQCHMVSCLRSYTATLCLFIATLPHFFLVAREL
jgi:hypothetical protein